LADAELAPGLTLAACEILTPVVSAQDEAMHPPSGWVHVRLWWRADGEIDDDYIATVQMVGPEGVWGDRLYRENEALRRSPTTSWETGEVVRDEIDVNLNPVTPPGEYPIVVGVMDYSYGNFKLLNTQPLPDVIPANLTEEDADPVAANRLTVATMNVENLDPGDDDAKFAGLASDIVNHLHSPDIIGLEEVQDNSGKEDDGVVSADQTYQKLINAIKAAGGPDYAFTDISPENNQDGGQPGGNIRVGILYRPDRVTFPYRPGGDATTPVSVISGSNGPKLSFNPGRIEPGNAAWEHSRKPLAAEFQFNGHTVFVIVNHFNSKYGDDYLFGRYQPPRRSSEVQRRQQAQVVQAFVAQILAIDSYADIIVLGDLNVFWFSDTVRDLQKDGVLTNLIERLPENERYTYIYQGNGQTLDHILISSDLGDRTPTMDIVHANAEFLDLPQRATDHDPVLASFYYGPPLSNHIWLPRVEQ